MRILHTVEQFEPSKGGMQEVVKQLSFCLSAKGHDVTIATSKNPNRTQFKYDNIAIVDFDISGNYVNGIKGEKEKYAEFITNSNFDVITNFAAQQWATDLCLPILEKIKSKKVFVPTGFSAFHNSSYTEYFNKLKSWIQDYDANVFLSQDYKDINFARDQNAKNIQVITNGANLKEFEECEYIDVKKHYHIPRDWKIILHVGSHTNLKGHKELIEFFEKLQTQKIVLLLIANTFSKRCSLSCKIKSVANNFTSRNKKIIVDDAPRNLTINAFKQADLFFFPSNIECSPLVLFEACAAKLPFASTDVGNSKEIAKWTSGGIILPTEKLENDLVKASKDSIPILDALLKDAEKRKKLAVDGYKNIKEKFTWDKISEEYELLYRSLLEGSND